MKQIQGRKRAVIEHVKPEVDGGEFPARRVVNEKVIVSADVFADGHDVVKAAILHRKKGAKKWSESPMHFLINDRWEGYFRPDQEGWYEYTVMGWVDHFSSWRKGIKLKFEANQNVSVDLQIGVDMIKNARQRASDQEHQQKLDNWLDFMSNSESQAAIVTLAMSDEVNNLMNILVDKSDAATYSKNLLLEVERKKALFSSWYELFPRSASMEPDKHGTFKDVENLLPEVAKMGFDVLYLPPIHPIGTAFRKGKDNAPEAKPGEPGSPWAIGSSEGGHKAIHSELGTLEDFKNLIHKASEHGLEMAIDIAFQCSQDHPYVKEHPQWFKWRPDGTVQYAENPPKKYQDVLPINFENDDWQNLWKELKSVFDYWIEQGVHIFRVDNPHTKSFRFWRWCIAEIKKEHPEIIFLAEAFTRPRVMERLAKIGFNQSYTYFTWRNSQHDFIQYLNELTRTDMRDFFRPNFWPNTPDILPESLQFANEAGFITRLVMAATLSSNFGIYGPAFEFMENIPHPAREEYINNEKYEIKNWDWFKNTRIKEVISLVNRIRKENAALQTTWNIYFAEMQNDQLLCYGKTDDDKDNKIFVAVNLDNTYTQGSWIKLPVIEMNIDPNRPYIMNDLLTGSKYTWNGEWNYVELNPHILPVHIFKVEQ